MPSPVLRLSSPASPSSFFSRLTLPPHPCVLPSLASLLLCLWISRLLAHFLITAWGLLSPIVSQVRPSHPVNPSLYNVFHSIRYRLVSSPPPSSLFSLAWDVTQVPANPYVPLFFAPLLTPTFIIPSPTLFKRTYSAALIFSHP